MTASFNQCTNFDSLSLTPSYRVSNPDTRALIMADRNRNRWTIWPRRRRPDGSAGQRWRTSTRQDQTISRYRSTSSGSRSREEHVTFHEKENVRGNQSGGSYWTRATMTTSARHWDWKSRLTSARSLTTRTTSTRMARSREQKTTHCLKDQDQDGGNL